MQQRKSMQRIIKKQLILGICLLLLPVSTLYALPGNVNADDTVNILDALLIARVSVGLEIPGQFLLSGDVDVNGEVNIVDALIIAQHYVGLIDRLPVGRPVPSRIVPMYEEITLAYGETVELNPGGGNPLDVILSFRNVLDSRCPEGLLCAWEGEAIITLEIWEDESYLETVEIRAGSESGMIQIDSSTYLMIDCRVVNPYPVDGVYNPPGDYTATLVISAISHG